MPKDINSIFNAATRIKKQSLDMEIMAHIRLMANDSWTMFYLSINTKLLLLKKISQ